MAFEESLKAISDEFLECYRQRDAEGCAGFYSLDGEMIDSQATSISGRSAIAEYFRKLMSDGTELSALQTVWHDCEGDLACAVQRVSGANTTVLLTLRREPDGKWQVTREMVVGGS